MVTIHMKHLTMDKSNMQQTIGHFPIPQSYGDPLEGFTPYNFNLDYDHDELLHLNTSSYSQG